jgi:hypothetical protein
MKLVLGVVDIPYSDEAPPHRVAHKKGSPINPAPAQTRHTTGEVAAYLEEHYQILERFAEKNKDLIEHELMKSVQGSLLNLLMGAPLDSMPFAEGTEAIAEAFRQFLDREELAGMGVPGVPTQAALRGVNPRLKGGHGPRRPSFVATGTYQRCMKAWTTK